MLLDHNRGSISYRILILFYLYLRLDTVLRVPLKTYLYVYGSFISDILSPIKLTILNQTPALNSQFFEKHIFILFVLSNLCHTRLNFFFLLKKKEYYFEFLYKHCVSIL